MQRRNLCYDRYKEFLGILTDRRKRMFLLCGFDSAAFELDDLKDYQREFQSESIGTCSSSSVKTYEDYRGISNTGSAQYRYIHDRPFRFGQDQPGL